MGFFSWDCYECGHPMLAPHATNHINGWMTDCVVITHTGRVVEGGYDGYGRLDGEEFQSDDPAWYGLLQSANYIIRHLAGGLGLLERGYWSEKTLDGLTDTDKEMLRKYCARADAWDLSEDKRERPWSRILAYHRVCWELAGAPRRKACKSRQSQRSADQGHFFDEGDHDFYPPRSLDAARSERATLERLAEEAAADENEVAEAATG